MRPQGKTKAMVERIPVAGSVVIVHTAPMKRYVEQMIGDLRGADVLKRCKIIVVEHNRDVQRLYGLRTHVSVDHAVIEEARDRAMVAHLRQVVDGIEAMRPAAA
jgi:DNA transposition AAA+ family ATPase